eukprot:scaffold19903_cov64-Phaeocystis_antarctica.AAC.1
MKPSTSVQAPFAVAAAQLHGLRVGKGDAPPQRRDRPRRQQDGRCVGVAFESEDQHKHVDFGRHGPVALGSVRQRGGAGGVGGVGGIGGGVRVGLGSDGRCCVSGRRRGGVGGGGRTDGEVVRHLTGGQHRQLWLRLVGHEVARPRVVRVELEPKQLARRAPQHEVTTDGVDVGTLQQLAH